MAVFKHLLTRGIYPIRGGVRDFESWSRLMLREEGCDVKPHLEKIFQWSLVCVSVKEGSNKKKKNCWEFHGCKPIGRRKRFRRSITCPAYIETRLHGMHGGENGGRACWVTAGEICCANIKKTRGTILNTCQSCDFYKMVIIEEGIEHVIPEEILNALII